MTEPITGQDAPQPESVTQPATRTETSTLPLDVQDYIKRLNDENAARRKENDKLALDMQTRRDTELAEQQRWQELAEQRAAQIKELENVKEHATGLEQTVQSVLDAQVAELPQEAQDAIKEMPGTAEQKLAWLSKNRATLTRTPAPQMHAGPRGDAVPPDVKLTALEEMIQKQSGISREDWIKNKQAQNKKAPETGLVAQLRSMNQE